jgi:hypothetical protein
VITNGKNGPGALRMLLVARVLPLLATPFLTAVAFYWLLMLVKIAVKIQYVPTSSSLLVETQ